jgi:hypothetical protein
MESKREIVMRNVYIIPGVQQKTLGELGTVMQEVRQDDIPKKIVENTAELVCDALKVGHNDRRLIIPLLEKVLGDRLNHRASIISRDDKRSYEDMPGWLQQFEDYIIETATKRMYTDLSIPENIRPNHEYATHAKYANIIVYLREQLFGPQKVKAKSS